MQVVLLLALSCLAVMAHAADSYSVIGTPAGDRVVLQFHSLPVAFSLAHLVVPDAQQPAAREAMNALLASKQVEVLYQADFGTDLTGAARVQVLVGKTNVNEELVARGLATYQPVKEGSAVEGVIKRAQDKARKAGVGMWKSGAGTAVVATASTAGAKPGATVVAKGKFCSELDNNFYYATGSREVANVSAQRLIFYPDEATAVKAGKKKQIKVEAVKRGTTEGDADAAYQLGKEITANAVDSGNTTARDELYEKAYTNLTQAMQIYTDLVDKNPNDEALAGKLQQCMQLRYGTVKMRRFTH